jgi:predicted homoserine dehydrogenase-like protein
MTETATQQRSELAALDDATLRTALHRMHLIRKFEETAEASYMRGLVHGTMHLSIGQEGSAVGATLHKTFCPREEGGLLSRKGVVDFTVAKGVAPGIFAVAEMRHPRLRERMSDLHLGEGPYYTFFRPYHLTSLEVPLSAAAAVLFGQSHMRPLPVPTAEVGARAKRDLAPGETLDAIGEYGYRGFALSRDDALALGALPLGLAQGARVTRKIAKGDYLTYANCAPDEALRIVQVRRQQDAFVRIAEAA